MRLERKAKAVMRKPSVCNRATKQLVKNPLNRTSDSPQALVRDRRRHLDASVRSLAHPVVRKGSRSFSSVTGIRVYFSPIRVTHDGGGLRPQR